MALVTCKECGKEVSRKAPVCPHCGAPGKRRTSPGTIIFGVFAGIFILGYIGAQLDPAPPRTQSPGGSGTARSGPQIYAMQETVSVGYTSYAVWEAWYSDQLTDDGWNDPPDASYLFVRLTVRNDDDQARTIPPIHLVDGQGREYDTEAAVGVDDNIGPLDDLNPDVQKEGVVVFDVPRGRDYRLKVNGGYWSDAEALVKLDVKS